MASQDGSGSTLFKVFIIALVVALIMVIIIPGQIWEKEEESQKTSRGNMATLFDAQRYYKSLKGEYCSNREQLVATIQNDSALIKRQQVVNHTTRLKNAMEVFLNTEEVQNFNKISSNVKSIFDDLNANKRFFRTIEDIDRRAEDLKMRLSNLQSGVEFVNYQLVMTHVDSMWQLRRDLTDYSLQSAARFASGLTLNITEELPAVDFASISKVWVPLEKQIAQLMSDVESTNLKSVTSVADRVADFRRDASDGLRFFLNNKSALTMAAAQKSSEDMKQVYNEFLSDFLITEEYAQYILTDSDSLLINIGENSFYTPGERKMYIMVLDDTTGLRIEDPTLLDELKEKAMVEVSRINTLGFMTAFVNYKAELDSLSSFYPEIKKAYRRNIDVMIKSKELESAINEIPETTQFKAYLDLKSYADFVPATNSYSGIKEHAESAIISLGLFEQIFANNVFSNLDSAHAKIVFHLDDYDNILGQIRGNTFSLEMHKERLNTALNQLKAISAESVLPAIKEIDEGMKSLFLFASEGVDQRVYIVFTTKVVNQGKIFGSTGRKSWEE